MHRWATVSASLQCYSVLSDIWVKIELCIPLESESSVLSTCNAFACLSPPSKLTKIRCAFLFYLQRADFVQCYTVLSEFRPMEDGDQCHVTK